jgi:YD repeat-containing protein
VREEVSHGGDTVDDVLEVKLHFPDGHHEVYTEKDHDGDGVFEDHRAVVYDADWRPLSITVHAPFDGVVDSETLFDYEQDAQGRVTQATRSGPEGTQVTTCEYDVDGRLTQVNESGVVTTYEYDLDGQLVRKVAPNYEALYSYDAEGRELLMQHLSSDISPDWNLATTYDADGNKLMMEYLDADGEWTQRQTHAYDCWL